MVLSPTSIQSQKPSLYIAGLAQKPKRIKQKVGGSQSKRGFNKVPLESQEVSQRSPRRGQWLVARAIETSRSADSYGRGYE